MNANDLIEKSQNREKIKQQERKDTLSAAVEYRKEMIANALEPEVWEALGLDPSTADTDPSAPGNLEIFAKGEGLVEGRKFWIQANCYSDREVEITLPHQVNAHLPLPHRDKTAVDMGLSSESIRQLREKNATTVGHLLRSFVLRDKQAERMKTEQQRARFTEVMNFDKRNPQSALRRIEELGQEVKDSVLPGEEKADLHTKLLTHKSHMLGALEAQKTLAQEIIQVAEDYADACHQQAVTARRWAIQETEHVGGPWEGEWIYYTKNAGTVNLSLVTDYGYNEDEIVRTVANNLEGKELSIPGTEDGVFHTVVKRDGTTTRKSFAHVYAKERVTFEPDIHSNLDYHVTHACKYWAGTYYVNVLPWMTDDQISSPPMLPKSWEKYLTERIPDDWRNILNEEKVRVIGKDYGARQVVELRKELSTLLK